MDIQSETRLLQIGPGISVSYTIFSSESIPPADFNAPEIGRVGDLFVSTSSLFFKDQHDQWIIVAEGVPVYNPEHDEYCPLLLSDTGPRWGYDGDTGVTILQANRQHLERIKTGDMFMPEDDDDLDDDDDDDEDDDDDDDDENEDEDDHCEREE